MKIPKRFQLIGIVSTVIISIVLIFLNLVSIHPLFKKYFFIKGEVSNIYMEGLYERRYRYSSGYVNNLIVVVDNKIKLKFSNSEYWEIIKQIKSDKQIEVLVSNSDLKDYENSKHQINSYYDHIYKLVIINDHNNERVLIYDYSNHFILWIFFGFSVFIITGSAYLFVCSIRSFILTNFTLEERKAINWLPDSLKQD